jgi:hypothetical protein
MKSFCLHFDRQSWRRNATKLEPLTAVLANAASRNRLYLHSIFIPE